MHHLYVENVIIYSQHSDISIKTGVALRLSALFFIYFLSIFIYTVRKPKVFFTIFHCLETNTKLISTINYNSWLSFRRQYSSSCGNHRRCQNSKYLYRLANTSIWLASWGQRRQSKGGCNPRLLQIHPNQLGLSLPLLPLRGTVEISQVTPAI